MFFSIRYSQNFLKKNGIHEIAAHRNMAIVEATAKLCMTKAAKQLCRTVVFNVFGPSEHYFDELLYTILNHIPAGASSKQFIHYFQIASTGN